LHHVGDLPLAVDKVAEALVPSGVLVVVEWAHELFDEATARWCFDRLPKEGHTFLHHHRDDWAETGLPWSQYVRQWARDEHRLHTWTEIERSLATRFTCEHVEQTPYYFPSLGISEDDEVRAIRSGTIQAGAIRLPRPAPHLSVGAQVAPVLLNCADVRSLARVSACEGQSG
jgi:hypothetical protein